MAAYWTLLVYGYPSKSFLVWGGSFKTHFLRVSLKCTHVLSKKNFFQHKTTVWLNLVSDILFVKTNKAKIQSIVYIFNFVFTLLIY